MIASLNQSSSLSSLGAALMSVTTSMARPSREAAEQQGGILLLIDAQTDAAPLEDVPFAGDQIFDGFDAPARGRWADLDLAEMKPELARSGLCQRHGDGHRIIACHRFLYETDDLVVVDLREAQIVGLQERRIVPPYTRVEHRAAAKAFPQNSDVAAGNRYHHVRLEHHRHKCRDHQVDHYTWEMAPNELPPPRWCRRRGRRPIYWPQIHFHHLFSTVCCATKRPFLYAVCERQVQLVNKTIVGRNTAH